MPPAHHIPLNLPHAGKISLRIVQLLDRLVPQPDVRHRTLFGLAEQLSAFLVPYHKDGENPSPVIAEHAVAKAARLGRLLVDEIERTGVKDDRLGQCIRNLFECLMLGAEGAQLSLRAGEDPKSTQRPV